MISLYPYQDPHAATLYDGLMVRRAALDTSDTGTGKTAVGAALADSIKFDAVLVVCPKPVLHEWGEWMERTKQYAGGMYDVVTWEKLRTGNTAYLKRPTPKQFQWRVPANTLIIWDEVHNAKNRKSLNAKMIDVATDAHLPQLFLSATPFQSPMDMYVVGRAIGLHQGGRDFWNWVRRHGVRKGRFGFEFNGDISHLEKISRRIYDEGRGSRMSIKNPEVRKFFRDNIITVDSYIVDDVDSINKAYTELAELGDMDDVEREDSEKMAEWLTRIDKIEDEDEYALALERVLNAEQVIKSLRLRQRIELYKVPLFADLVRGDINGGNWPVVFVNYRATLNALYEQLHKDFPVYIIHGGLNKKVRASAMKDFQASDLPCIMLATTPSIGTGTNLQDTKGGCPRIATHSPGYNAVQTKQALGRIHRSGMQTIARQRMVFAAHTPEERVCDSIRRKLSNIATLNNDDLTI